MVGRKSNICCCPFCGHKLKLPLKDGVSNCLNCKRTFDNSTKNYLLSIAWMVRKYNFQTDIKIVKENIVMSHEEFSKYLDILEKCDNLPMCEE